MRRKITVLINDNDKELYPSENISGVTSESTLTVESVTVFWDYNNVIKGVNDTFTHNGNIIVVPEGYWTSDMITGIRDRLIIHVDNGTTQYYDSIAQLFILQQQCLRHKPRELRYAPRVRQEHCATCADKKTIPEFRGSQQRTQVHHSELRHRGRHPEHRRGW